MESSGVVTSIREPRIPHREPISDGRRKLNTPALAELPRSGPKTREEVVKFQLDAIDIVAPKLKEGLSWGEAREIGDAVAAAKSMKGVWPKAEFLARLSDAGLFSRALKIFEQVEAFRAVA